MAVRFILLFFAQLISTCTAFCAYGGYNARHSSMHRASLAGVKHDIRAGVASCVQEGTSRRAFCIASPAVISLLLQPGAAQAAKATFTLDENGEYVEVKDREWTEEWKDRASKMQSMSPDEIFMAGRGATNTPVSELSDAGKKRRALAACRVDATRKAAKVDATAKAAKVDEQRAGGLGVDAAAEALASLRAGDTMTEKACITRVLQGELAFILDVM